MEGVCEAVVPRVVDHGREEERQDLPSCIVMHTKYIGSNVTARRSSRICRRTLLCMQSAWRAKATNPSPQHAEPPAASREGLSRMVRCLVLINGRHILSRCCGSRGRQEGRRDEKARPATDDVAFTRDRDRICLHGLQHRVLI